MNETRPQTQFIEPRPVQLEIDPLLDQETRTPEEVVCEALSDPEVAGFVYQTTLEGYLNIMPQDRRDMANRVGQAFEHLMQARTSAEDMAQAAAEVSRRIFETDTRPNAIQTGYKEYKNKRRSGRELDHVTRLTEPGSVVLDIGTGTGFLAQQLQEHRPDLRVVTTDILDLRINGARKLPFAQKDELTLPFRDGSAQTSLIVSVLHHVDPRSQQAVIAEAARVTTDHILLQEDTRLSLPDIHRFFTTRQLNELAAKQPNLLPFLYLNPHQQQLALAFTDYFSNKVLSNLEMPMPFSFHDIHGWEARFNHEGFDLVDVDLLGFPSSKVTQNSQAWLTFKRRVQKSK